MREGIIFCLIVLAAMVGWYHFYVAPRDVMYTDIIRCMDEDRSREAYDRCAEKYTNDRG